MAHFFYGMMQSLDGYVADASGGLVLQAPDAALFQHFVQRMEACSASIYGRKVYELMRYWEQDHADWGPEEMAFAKAWRATPKYVFSTTLNKVGPMATLIQRDVKNTLQQLKASLEGQVEVAGPQLAGCLTQWGLIDEYWLYFRPQALGAGKPYFTQCPSKLRLEGHERLGPDTVLLRYLRD